MVQHVGGVNTNLEALDPPGFTQLERLGGRLIQVPGSRRLDEVLTEIASSSGTRVLQNDRTGGAVRVSNRQRIDCATVVPKEVELHRIINIGKVALRIPHHHKWTRVAEVGSAVGVS